MSDKTGGHSGTQKMEVLKHGEVRSGGVGKRVFDGGEQRGLAAYDKGGKSGGEKPALGSVRDTGDADLRHARLDARDSFAEDDGMVVTSGSNWADLEVPAARKGRAAPVVEVEEEEEEEEVAPARRGGAWKWIVGALVVGGVGTGAYFGVTALSGAPAPAVVAEVKPKPKPAVVAEEDEDGAAAGQDEKEGKGEKDADDKGAAGKEEKGEKVADGKVPAKADGLALRLMPMSSAPAAWAASVEASNPWVALAPAAAASVLGLSDAETQDAMAATRTGFRPAAKLAAPLAGYRMQTHEVTWGELALATTLTEVATLTRPKWLPRDAKRQANLPATGVPWAVALAFCNGLGGDLPSESEWEWAARGSDARYFPWGRDAFTPSEVHFVGGRPVPVAAVATSKLDRTPGAAPIWDLLANAQEWTRDPYRAAETGALPDAKDAKAATQKAVRGWPLRAPGTPTPAEGATYRAPGCADPSCLSNEGLDLIGFRCVRGG